MHVDCLWSSFLLGDKLWFGLAFLVAGTCFVRHLRRDDQSIEPKNRRTLATARAADVAASVLTLWGAMAVLAAVTGFIGFSELEAKKVAL